MRDHDTPESLSSLRWSDILDTCLECGADAAQVCVLPEGLMVAGTVQEVVRNDAIADPLPVRPD